MVAFYCYYLIYKNSLQLIRIVTLIFYLEFSNNGLLLLSTPLLVVVYLRFPNCRVPSSSFISNRDGLSSSLDRIVTVFLLSARFHNWLTGGVLRMLRALSHSCCSRGGFTCWIFSHASWSSAQRDSDAFVSAAKL